MVRADLLVVHAGELLTLRGPQGPRRGKAMGSLGIVRDGAVAIRGAEIVDVGTTAQLRSRVTADREFDAEGRVVMPGFVDAHTHLPFVGTREFELEMKLQGKTYLEILRAGGGIHYTVKRTREATLGDIVRLVKERLAAMLTLGTTTCEAKSGYGLNAADEIKQLTALALAGAQQPVEIVPTLLAAHVVPREYRARRRRYVDLVLREILPRVAKHRLAEACDAFLEKDAFTATECRTILSRAAELGLRTKLHADEFTNQKGAELAARLGCESAEHLLRVSRRGIRALSKAPTVAVLLPGVSVTNFLPNFAPARGLIDAGVAVALGTDFNPNCHVLSMPAVVQWACYHLRMTPAEAIVAATVNAAHAVGRAERVGSLEVGKQADLLVLDSDKTENLVYRIGANPVDQVIKKGVAYATTTGTSKPRSQRWQ